MASVARIVLPGVFFLLALVAGVGMWYVSGVGETGRNPLLATQGTVPVPAPGATVAAAPTAPPAEPRDGALVVGARAENRQVVLYLMKRTDMSRLVPVTITMDTAPGTRDLVDRVVNALQGPFEDASLVPTVPKGTKLLSVFQARKQLLVNLSRDVAINHPGGMLASRMTVYSLVNTLVDLGLGDEIRIMIQGREESAFMDHLDLTRPLVFDPSIVQGKQLAMEPEPEKPASKSAAGKLGAATAAAAAAKKSR